MMNQASRTQLVAGLISAGVIALALLYGDGIEFVQGALNLDNIFPSWFNFGQDWQHVSAKILDHSNDEAAELNTHGLLTRAGFDYENHYCLADDGYVTQLIRIVNPLADKSKLRIAPILLVHGQTSNSRNFVMQSNSQHRPMRWPPRADPSKPSGGLNLGALLEESQTSSYQGPQSSNRSLALMLANNGYDVWLATTRGADQHNRGYLKGIWRRTLKKGFNRLKANMTGFFDKLLEERSKRRNYWAFTLDDQIEYELPSQIAVVLNVTGAPKITLMGYSNSALTTLSMLSIRQDIGKLVDTYIGIAPVLYYNNISGWFKWFIEDFVELFPKNLDADLFISDKLANFVRRIMIRGCHNLPARYTICKFFLDLLFGASPRFQTNLEPPFFGHLVWPTSWRSMAQHVQHIKSHKMAKFDYGPELNKQYYGTAVPPEYSLEKVNPDIKIGFVSGVEDCWANQATLDEARNRLPRKPDFDLVLKDYNHLDLTAAFEVDIKVNIPIMNFVNLRNEILAAQYNVYSKRSEPNPNGTASFIELKKGAKIDEGTLEALKEAESKNDGLDVFKPMKNLLQWPSGSRSLSLAPRQPVELEETECHYGDEDERGDLKTSD